MKKRYTGVLAALAAGVLIFSTGITGEAARTGTITTDGSRVRATADAEGQKVCSLPTLRLSKVKGKVLLQGHVLPAYRYDGRHYR